MTTRMIYFVAIVGLLVFSESCVLFPESCSVLETLPFHDFFLCILFSCIGFISEFIDSVNLLLFQQLE